MSASLMNKLKWDNRLLVNGVPCFTNHPVKTGDVIRVLLPEVETEYPAENGELTVLYEDDHILAVDKPSGMLIHPSRACNTGTLANFVLGYYKSTGQNSAFHPMTGLTEYLKSKGEKDIITIGVSTDYCMDATIKCGFEHGFRMIVPEYTNSTFDNAFMTAEQTYRYYNEFMWKGRYAECVSIEEALALL